MKPPLLIEGDCLEAMRSLPAASVDLVLADLPYGTTACKWDSPIPMAPLWEAYRRLLAPGGAAVLMACQPFTSTLLQSNPRWFRHETVWDKVGATGFLDANRKPLRRHESILVFCPVRPTYHPQMGVGVPYVARRKRRVVETLHDRRAAMLEWTTVNAGARFPTSIVRFSTSNGGGKLHPTQKPVALMEYLARTYSDEGATVLDNVMGSGTTGVACVNAGRRFIGIERDPGYFAIASRRIGEASSTTEVA